MGITIIPADGPTFSEAFTDQFGRSYEGSANRYQSDKATRIQEALHRDQMAQQQKQFEESQARMKAQDAAMEQYRQDNLQRMRDDDAAKRADAEAKKAEAEAKRQQAESARAAQQGYVEKYGTDADKAYFSAFGKLPASHDPARHTTAGADPEAKKVKAQLDALDDQYRYWSAQKKDAENSGDRDPDASDTEQRAKKGKEDQYRAAVKHMMAIEAMQSPLRRRAFEMAGGTMPAAPDATNPGGVNPFETTAIQQAAPAAVKIEDLNVPLPAGVQPFNRQGGVPGQAAPPQPTPQNMAPQSAQPPAPPAVQFTPEQARDLLDVVAAKHGKRPGLIQQMPPAPLSKVAELKAAAFKNHSDPLKAREFFYDLMILNGFNPLAAPVPDEQYQRSESGRTEVRVLE